VEGDVEPAMEDPTSIRKTAGTPTASPRHITLISVSTSPSPATNTTGRHQKMTPATTAVNLATNAQVAQSREEVRPPGRKLNVQEPLVAVRTSPQLAKIPATAQGIDELT
jgi:hypothetical protein